jgi:hypothetical protein
MPKPSQYVIELFHTLRKDVSWIKNKLFIEQPKSKPTESPHQYTIDAIHTRGQASEKDQESVRVTLNLPPSIRVDAKTEEHPKQWNKDRMFLAQIGGILVGAIVAAIYLGQLITMNHTLKVSRDQFDMSRKTAERESRALVSIKAIGDITAGENEVPTIQIKLTNMGKTIARKVESEAYMEIVPRTKGPTFVHPDGTPNVTYKSADMFPGDTDGFPDKRDKAMAAPVDGQEAEEWPLSKEEYESLTRGDTYLAAHGIVVYVDIYQVKHWSRFCTHQFLAKDPVLGSKHTYAAMSCTEDNTTDTNDEP